MIYDTNNWLKFILQEEKRLLIIEGDGDAQNNKEDP